MFAEHPGQGADADAAVGGQFFPVEIVRQRHGDELDGPGQQFGILFIVYLPLYFQQKAENLDLKFSGVVIIGGDFPPEK